MDLCGKVAVITGGKRIGRVVARELAERGMNLSIVAQLLGHTDVKVTAEYYGTFADADLQNAHQRYSLGDVLQ